MRVKLCLAFLAYFAYHCIAESPRIPSGYQLKYPPPNLPYANLTEFYNELHVPIYTALTYNGPKRRVMQCLYDNITAITDTAVFFTRTYWTPPKIRVALALRGDYFERLINRTFVQDTAFLVFYAKGRSRDPAMLSYDAEYLIYLNSDKTCGVLYVCLIEPRGATNIDWCEIRVKGRENNGQDCAQMYTLCRDSLDVKRSENQLATKGCDLRTWRDT